MVLFHILDLLSLTGPVVTVEACHGPFSSPSFFPFLSPFLSLSFPFLPPFVTPSFPLFLVTLFSSPLFAPSFPFPLFLCVSVSCFLSPNPLNHVLPALQSVHRLNWLADVSPRGLSKSAGIMVNYLYRCVADALLGALKAL